MPKRFTDSSKWSDRWYRTLSPESKLAWLYLLDNCDQAGVIELDVSLADFQIGKAIDWPAFLAECGERIQQLNCGKYWIRKFVEFQYGSKLSRDCKAHNPIFFSIEKHSLPIPLPKSLGRVQVKEKVKVKVKVEDNEKGKDNGFSSWYEIYPRKKAPTKAKEVYAKAIATIAKEERVCITEAAALLFQWTQERVPMVQAMMKPDSDFRPYPASWLRNGSYRDPVEATTSHPVQQTAPSTKVGGYINATPRRSVT